MCIIRYFALLVVFSTYIPLAQADTLLIDSVQSGQSISKPRAGIEMNQVVSRFGQPKSRMPGIGEPPISRWDYGNFIVYFEHKHVVHAVIPH